MCARGESLGTRLHLVQALLSIPVLIRQNPCCPIVLVCLLVLCSKYGQSSGEEPLRIIAGSQVSVPLISRPVICYRKGGTTPKKLWILAGVLFWYCHCCRNFSFFFLSFSFLCCFDTCTIVYSHRLRELYYTLCNII